MSKSKETTRKRANGEGTLYQKPNGDWVCQIFLGRRPDGKPDRKAFTGKTQGEVIKAREEFLFARKIAELSESRRAELPVTIPAPKMLFNDWVRQWIELYKHPPLTKATTYSSYMDMYKTHIEPFFQGLDLSEVDVRKMQEFYTYKATEGRVDGKPGGLSPKSIRNLHNMLHSCLDQAKLERRITINPSEGTSRPKVLNSEMRVLTNDEMRIFLSEIMKETQRMLFLFALFTGLRLGELLALEWTDVDFTKKTVTVRRNLVRIRDFSEDAEQKTRLLVQPSPKTAKSHRTLPIFEDLFQLLMRHLYKLNHEDWPNPNNLVFPSTKGTYLDPRSIQRRTDAISKRCEIQHVNPHALRHTFATRLVEQKVPIRIIQELMGHSGIQTTMRYAHAMEEEKGNAMDSLASLVPFPVKGGTGNTVIGF